MDVREILIRTPLFAEALEREQLDALAAEARVVEYEPGSTIIREHESGESMYVVVSGKVMVTIHDGAGDRSVATLTPGTVFGEISVLTGLPRLGTVTAGDRVAAVEITKSMLQPILAAAPRLYDRLAALLQKRQGDLDQIVDPGFWSKFDRSRDNLSKVMRRHFGEPS